ncbi:MAG: transposase [Chlorobi bacterium]|nr:transposase [Chlorobiota bacterium]
MKKKTQRTFSAAFKAEVALEAIKGIKTISELSQEYEVHPVQINSWKKEFLARLSDI